MNARALARALARAVLAAAALAAAAASAAPESLTLGILATRPKALLEARYEPLADYLTARLGGPRVVVRLLTREEFDEALRLNQLDLALTDPTHYLLLRSRSSLAGTLATVEQQRGATKTSSLGGVIVAPGDSTLSRLADLRGKRIAIPGRSRTGGFQAQALELQQAGVRVPEDVTLVTVEDDDAVVRAVLAGRADAGFVRTGEIEALRDEGALGSEPLRVVNRQNLGSYPFATSTRLYPEWPFVALPHVEERLVKRIAGALLTLEPGDPAAAAAGLAGFAPPADYLPAEELARGLHVPPYDKPPAVALPVVLAEYGPWLAAMGVMVALLAVAAAALVLLYRRARDVARVQRALVAGWPEPMLLIAEGRYVEANPAAFRLLGLRGRDDIVGRRPEDLSPPVQPGGEPTPAAIGRLMAYAERGQTHRFEWAHRHADGHTVTVNVTLSPIQFRGRPVVLCAWHDLTAVKDMQRELADSESRFRSFFEKNSCAMLLIEPETGTIVAANQAASDLYGHPLGRMVGMSTGEINPAPPAELLASRRSAMTGTLRHLLVRNRLASGEMRDVEVYGTPIRAGGADLLFTIAHDVTERMRAEASLRAERRRLADIIAATRVGTWEWTVPTGESVYDERWAAMIGYRLADLAPVTIGTWRRLVHPDDLARADAALARHFAGETDHYECEIRLRHHDGGWVWILTHGRVVEWGADGAPLRMAGTHQDITEAKRAEAALHDLNAELERRVAERTGQLEATNRELESFSYSVSHDLRAPLRAVAGYANILREDEGERLSPAGMGYLAKIEANAIRMGELIDALLALGRLTRHRFAGKRVDVAALAREVAAELGPAYPAARIAVDELPPAHADATLLKQVFVNLLGNALKFSRRADAPVVRVSFEDGAYVVRDNGAGFDMAWAGKLFKPFERLHPGEEFEGTGVGLAIVKLVVERHGGTVSALAEAGRGAEFRFTLAGAVVPAVAAD